MMKAAICEAYGGPEVVRVREVARPVAKANEVLIRVHATTVSSGDARMRASRFPGGFWLPARLMLGLTRPRQPILGTELAGVIEAVGADVTRFRVGEAVFAFSGARFGGHAEFKTMKEDAALALKPTGLSFAEAAAISFGGATALHFLRTVGRVRRGERVLVNGASGAVGAAAVQLARHFGARVTGVCSAANVALVRSLGAAEAIDYNQTDFAASGERWDIIFDAVGNAPFARCRRVLADQGRLLLLAGGLGELLKAPFQSLSSGRKVAGGPAPERAQDLAVLKELCESGAYRPVIGSRYPFERIAEAHALVDSGRKVGSMVVTLDAARP
jgi:NADPH:quinone reductase-like Zn-dependent oxidoreductase